MAQASMTLADLPSGQFRVGGILSKALQVYSRRPVTLTLITVSAWVPLFLAGVALAAMGLTGNLQTAAAGSQPAITPENAPTVLLISFGALAAILIFAALSSAVTFQVVLQDMRRSPVRIGEAVSRGFSRFFPMLGLFFLMGSGIVIGVILLVVPGIMWMTMWAVAIPVCVFEKLGPARSLGRSRQLTKGYRWKVFAVIMLFFGINVVVSLAQRFGAIYVGSSLYFAGIFAKLLVIALYNVALAVVYHDLRVIKEGIDIEGVAAVFD